MPIPIPPPAPEEVPVWTPAPPSPAQGRRYYLRETQSWVISQERQRHRQALYSIGEWVFLILMWHQLDFEYGLVERCTRCWAGATTTKAYRVAEVYKQPIQNECPVCFGTTFEGGYRARIVRPAIVTDVEETERQDRKGSMHPAGTNVETTEDFRTRPGDFMIRADGSRWRLTDAQRIQVRTGHGHPTQPLASIAYKLRAAYEETTTVAYLLPPTSQTEVRAVLRQVMRFPGNFAASESLRGPLVPDSIID